MLLSRNKPNNVYPCKPQFYYIKVGFKGVKIIQACFRDVKLETLSMQKSYQAATMVPVVQVTFQSFWVSSEGPADI